MDRQKTAVTAVHLACCKQLLTSSGNTLQIQLHALNYGDTDGMIMVNNACSKTKKVWGNMALNQICLVPPSVAGEYKTNSYHKSEQHKAVSSFAWWPVSFAGSQQN